MKFTWSFSVRKSLPLAMIFLPLMLSACANTGTEQTDASKKNFSLSGLKNSWSGLDPKYSELAKGPLAGEIGTNLSRAALKQAIEAEYRALENNKPGEFATWKHSDDQMGRITPFPPYQVGSSDCRRYVHRVSIEGTVRQATGTACRDKQGVWSPLT